MLQNLRDNLKGTVAVFVLLIFVVPLVLFGVEQLFVGSAGQKDVAEVNGEGISSIDYRRELEMEKQRLVQQFGVEPDSPQLEDRNLRGPVIQRMVQRTVLQQAAEGGGLGVSKDELWKEIAAVEAFQVDGKFDYDIFKQRISAVYTPAQYLDALAGDYLIDRLRSGITSSSFVTNQELALVAAITQQRRSFFTIHIPPLNESVVVADEQITEFYEKNRQQYTESESVEVSYLELSLEELADEINPTDDDIRSAYEAELREFKAAPRYEIAHVQLDFDADEAKIAEVEGKIKAGEDFAELAQQYSIDLGSKESGGNLGELDLTAFPDEFRKATEALEVGSVSGPVKSASGIHFIKLLGITNQVAPGFDERKGSIAVQLSRSMAQDVYAEKIAELDELTFGKVDLASVAERLGLRVGKSEAFTRNAGTGVSESAKVREAAFTPEVLREGYNSRVIELEDDRAVVLHVEKHTPERVKPLDIVREEIEQHLEAELRSEMIAAKAADVVNRLRGGEKPEELAESEDYEYRFFDDSERSNAELDRVVLQKVFSLPRPTEEHPLIFDHAQMNNGGAAVLGLLKVSDGSFDQLSDAQLASTRQQLENQVGQTEMSAFERSTLDRAKTRMPD